MRTALVSTLLILAFVGAAAANGAAPSTWTHVRPLTATAGELLADATGRSAIVAGLTRELDRTDLVVYLTDSMAGGADEPKTYLTFLASAGGRRYLLVRIDRWRISPRERIAWLAHEFRHALEVASAPEVRDQGGLARLYRRIGWGYGHGRFESEAAVEVGRLVRDQLAGLQR